MTDQTSDLEYVTNAERVLLADRVLGGSMPSPLMERCLEDILRARITHAVDVARGETNVAESEPCTCKRREDRAPDHRGCRRHYLLALIDEVNDLRSRLACANESTYWDRPYEERIAAVRGMCDLTTDGMSPGREDDPEIAVVVYAFDLDEPARRALFDRVADAAHALDEQVMCAGLNASVHPR